MYTYPSWVCMFSNVSTYDDTILKCEGRYVTPTSATKFPRKSENQSQAANFQMAPDQVLRFLSSVQVKLIAINNQYWPVNIGW